MPRPGPRPYLCERRAWHSDRHQPMRGSLIQEIFRIVNEIHNPTTRKNKEWQQKLPVVVFKVEEIMYSKANSEAEYMDPKTLWDRANDAINTIIRRDESTETGHCFLQPCIEAALNLGCTPRRTLRSERYNTQTCYLNTSTQEAETFANNKQYITNYSDYVKPTTTSKTHSVSESQKHVFASNNVKQCPVSSHSQCYGAEFQAEEPRLGSGISLSNKVEAVEPNTQTLLSCDGNNPNNITQIHVRNIPENPHEHACDLSLRLGPFSLPCSSASISDSEDVEVLGSTAPAANLTPSIGKTESFLAFRANNANARKRKADFLSI